MEWLVVIAIVLLFLGASRFPEAGRNLGRAFRAFREELKSPKDKTG